MTHRILLVIPDLDYSGATTRLALLAEEILRAQFQPHVCVLGQRGPVADALSSAGVEVTALGWKRFFDLNPLRRLRQLVASFRPEVIHSWRPASLRALTMAGGRFRGRLIGCSLWEKHRSASGLGWVQQRLVQRVDHVVVSFAAETEEYRALGLAETNLQVIPPAARAPQEAQCSRETLRHSLGLPEGARLLMCVGPLEPHKGFGDAIWAFDILLYLGQHWHLVVIGDGSDRARLEAFTRAIGATDRIHFLGPQADGAALLSQAEVIWIPSRTAGGVQVALEAMAAGRAVIASRLPGLAEVVVDGETGFLIPPRDKVTLARRTRLFLEDAELRARMGTAGRDRVTRRFAVADWVQRWVRLYENALAA